MQSKQNQCWHGVRAGSSSIPRQMGHRSDSVACSTSMTSSSCPAIAMDDAQDQQGKGYFSSTILPWKAWGELFLEDSACNQNACKRDLHCHGKTCPEPHKACDYDKHIDKSEDDQSADNSAILVEILQDNSLEYFRSGQDLHSCRHPADLCNLNPGL